jgi:hypothetical protein
MQDFLKHLLLTHRIGCWLTLGAGQNRLTLGAGQNRFLPFFNSYPSLESFSQSLRLPCVTISRQH